MKCPWPIQSNDTNSLKAFSSALDAVLVYSVLDPMDDAVIVRRAGCTIASPLDTVSKWVHDRRDSHYSAMVKCGDGDAHTPRGAVSPLCRYNSQSEIRITRESNREMYSYKSYSITSNKKTC
jgi:hypothetical protein